MSFAMVQGDLEPDMLITLRINGIAENISDASAYVMKWRKPDGTVSSVALTSISFPDLILGRLKRVWVAGDTDVPGRHYGQVRVTRGNGEFQTWPNHNEYFQWEVIPLIA